MVKHQNYTIAEDERIPSMRIAVTGACNLKCQYCPVDGDNYVLKSEHSLEADEFSRIAMLANEVGVRHFSITGGEPLTIPKVTFDLARKIKSFSDLGYLRLNTNGVFLERYADEVKDIGFHKVKVSIDSLQSGKYVNPSLKDMGRVTDSVLNGIKSMQERKIPVRVNMVVGKYNIGEVPEMIQFCEENKLELKLFDITYYRNKLSPDPNFWHENYMSLISLSNELKREYGHPKIVYAVGGFGNPMPVFKADSDSPIRLRVSEGSAFYRDECVDCQDYICQDGFCNITLTTDGDIKPCRPEGLDFDLRLTNNEGILFPDKEISGRIRRAINLFQGATKKNRTLDEMIKSWN